MYFIKNGKVKIVVNNLEMLVMFLFLIVNSPPLKNCPDRLYFKLFV
jgi:hypothetical protein